MIKTRLIGSIGQSTTYEIEPANPQFQNSKNPERHARFETRRSKPRFKSVTGIK
jgi:hypothetical protein